MSAEAYGAYLCTRDLPNELVVELLGVSETVRHRRKRRLRRCPRPTPTVRPTRATARSARRPERAGRPAGMDPGESDGGLARAGPPRARRRRERPADAAHVHRSTGDTGSDIAPWVDIRDGDGRHQHRVTSSSSRTSRRSWIPPSMDRVWRCHRRRSRRRARLAIRDRQPAPRPPGMVSGDHRAWRTDLHTGRTETTQRDRIGHRAILCESATRPGRVSGRTDATLRLRRHDGYDRWRHGRRGASSWTCPSTRGPR